MKPSDIEISEAVPLTATFDRTVNEIAAAMLILACVDKGDEWQPIVTRDVGLAIKERVKTYTWIEFALRFGKFSFYNLVELGDVEWVGEEGGNKRPMQFTEQGLEKLRKSRWAKATAVVPTPDAGEKATRTEPNCGRCIDSGWVWGRQLPGDRAEHVTDQKYDCPYCELGDTPDTTPDAGETKTK